MRNTLPLVHRAMLLGRATLVALLVLPFVACCCPPLRTSFSTPEETLATWQAHLCHDEPDGEYRCLSKSLQREMYGFPSYFAARTSLLEEEPLLAFLLKRIDLGARAVDRLTSSGGQRVSLVFEEQGERFTIEFVLETSVEALLADGSTVAGRNEGPLAGFAGQHRGRQWVDFPQPPLSSEQIATLLTLTFEQHWKIASIAGLSPPPQVSP